MRKFTSFLNEISDGEDSEYEAFEFLRFHAVGFNTYINKNALLYGTAGLLKSDRNNFYQDYSKNGYITGFFSDHWHDTEGLWESEEKQMDPFYTFDHTGTTISWDYNYEGVDVELSFGVGINDQFERCLYGTT